MFLFLCLSDTTAPGTVPCKVAETRLTEDSLINIENLWNGKLQGKLQAFGEKPVLLLYT